MTPDLRAKIRQLFYAEHWRVGTIASELELHHDVVENAIEKHRFLLRGSEVKGSILDPYKSFIKEVLDKHKRLRATRIHAMIKSRGYPGSVVQVRRYVKTIRPTQSEAYLRIDMMPGEEAQVDWGSFGHITVGRARRKLSCFVLVLSYSRGMFARFTLDQQMERFLDGHIEAFGKLGGVPRALLYDNLKSAVLERDGDFIRFHPTLLDLAGHYHFTPKPCTPRRPNQKGKVERAIQYLRHSFFAARPITTLERLNAELDVWIQDVAHARICPRDPERRSVNDVLVEERPRLLPGSEHPFSSKLVRPIRTRKEPYVRFDLNDYSIPHDYAQKPLTLVASASEVEIHDSLGVCIARHARSYDRGAVLEHEEHLAGITRERRAADLSRSRDRLRQKCPSAKAFIEILAQRQEPMLRPIRKLNELLDLYTAADLEDALQIAIGRQSFSTASVTHILEQMLRARNEKPPMLPILPDDSRIRDLRVDPHDLKTYDQLVPSDDAEGDL